MKFGIAAVSALLFIGGADAFSPVLNTHQQKQSRSDLSLLMAAPEEPKGSKRKAALKVLSRVAGGLGAVAAATAVAPSAALAAAKARVEVSNDIKKMVGIGAGVVAAGAVGYKVLTSTSSVTGSSSSDVKQDFLEASPYWDQSSVPVNTFKNKAPFTGKVVSTKRIVGPKATGETCHIVIDHEGKFPYWEGQSWGAIPPGVREKDGKPHSVRLYSIASSRYGDDMTGNTGFCRRSVLRRFRG